MCTDGGGEYEPYTCQDAEDFLTGMESLFLDSDTKEYIRTQWGQPRCCGSISFDGKEKEDKEELNGRDRCLRATPRLERSNIRCPHFRFTAIPCRLPSVRDRIVCFPSLLRRFLTDPVS